MLIRPYNSKDLDAVLDIIEKSDSTNRTKETWLGNDMTAIMAFEEERLIGIIPFEPHKIILGKNSEINALWVSAAHVEPEYRGKGIGTKLDDSIKDSFFPEYEAIFVVRKDEGSAAYRWYIKLGYQNLFRILSFKKDVTSGKGSQDFLLLETSGEFEKHGGRLMECFNRNVGECGGYPERDEKFWIRKFNHHYYKSAYEYKIVAIVENEIIQGYALLGKSNFGDEIDRFDMLEIIIPQEEKIRNDLINAIFSYADKMSLKEVRIQFAEGDSLIKWAEGLGFKKRWETNVLGKYIEFDKKFLVKKWKYFHIDYI